MRRVKEDLHKRGRQSHAIWELVAVRLGNWKRYWELWLSSGINQGASAVLEPAGGTTVRSIMAIIKHDLDWNMTDQKKIKDTYPDRPHVLFNMEFDRRSTEQLVIHLNNAIVHEYDGVVLCLSSSGGVLDQAYYAHSVISGMNLEIDTFNIGNIRSACNFIFALGKNRYCVPDSTFYFHQTGFDLPGGMRLTEKVAKERLNIIEHDDERSARLIAERIGRSASEVREWYNEEKTFTAQQALELGLVTEVKELSIPGTSIIQQVVY